jgi:hypothetical protein
MSIILKGFGIVTCLFILMMLLGAPCFGGNMKTAYTRDGVNFISKYRVDENIQAGIAKPDTFFGSRADAHAEQSKTPDRAGRYNYYKVEGDFSAETSPFEAHLKGESTIGIESRPLNLCSPQRR